MVKLGTVLVLVEVGADTDAAVEPARKAAVDLVFPKQQRRPDLEVTITPPLFGRIVDSLHMMCCCDGWLDYFELYADGYYYEAMLCGDPFTILK